MPTPEIWYRQKPWDDSLLRLVRQNLSHCAALRSRELTRMAVLALAYEADWWGDQGDWSGWMKDPFCSGQQRATRGEIGDRIFTINVLKESVDAVVNKVVEQPDITVTTVGATFEQMRIWDSRQRALNHGLNTPEVSETMRAWALDGLVRRIGWTQWRHDTHGGRVVQRRHQPWQLHFDPHDAATTNKPTFVHVVELVDRDHFLDWYKHAQTLGEDGKAKPVPDHDVRLGKIRSVSRSTEHINGHSNAWQGAYRYMLASKGSGVDTTDRIRVVHSWRRARRAGTPNGRYVMTVLGLGDNDSVVALDYAYRRDSLPVVEYVPMPTHAGLRGIALADPLLALQSVIDRTIWKIWRVQDKYGHHKVWVHEETSDDVIAAALTAGIVLVRASNPRDMPRLIPPQVLAPEQLKLLEWALNVPTSQMGITPIVSEGRSQLGANASGRAQVEEDRRSRDRQSHLIDAFTNARIRAAREYLNTVEDAVRLDRRFAAQFKDVSGQWVSESWAELTQMHEAWILRPETRGSFAGSRAARISRVEDSALKGEVSPQQAFFEVTRAVDEWRLNSRANASQAAVERHLWILSDPDADHSQAQPSRDLDLPLAIEITRKVIQLAISQNAKPATITRYRQYLYAASQLLPAEPPPATVPGIPA